MELCSIGSVVLQQNGRHNQLCQVIPPVTSAEQSVATIVGSRLGETFAGIFECDSVHPIASKLISSVWTN
jgi:precorrin-3B methylase